MNIIETENLSYKYDESHFALSDLSIGFEKGKITTILGANGAGKSTLFLNMNRHLHRLRRNRILP